MELKSAVVDQCGGGLISSLVTSFPPSLFCGEGSGINPDFAVECDADLGFCVPSKPIPSFTIPR